MARRRPGGSFLRGFHRGACWSGRCSSACPRHRRWCQKPRTSGGARRRDLRDRIPSVVCFQPPDGLVFVGRAAAASPNVPRDPGCGFRHFRHRGDRGRRELAEFDPGGLGPAPAETSAPFTIAAIAVVVALVLLVTGRLFLSLSMRLQRRVRRYMPPRIAAATGLLIAVAIFAGLIDGVAVRFARSTTGRALPTLLSPPRPHSRRQG